jgi:hypothetical protein
MATVLDVLYVYKPHFAGVATAKDGQPFAAVFPNLSDQINGGDISFRVLLDMKMCGLQDPNVLISSIGGIFDQQACVEGWSRDAIDAPDGFCEEKFDISLDIPVTDEFTSDLMTHLAKVLTTLREMFLMWEANGLTT